MDYLWVSCLFYLVFVYQEAVSGKKKHFRECRWECGQDKKIEYGLYSIFEWIFVCRHGCCREQIDKEAFEGEVAEYLSEVEESSSFSDWLFGRVGLSFVRCAYKHDRWFSTLLNITILWSFVCYRTLNVLFTVCLLLLVYLCPNYKLLDYMGSSYEVAYYAIPIGSFLLLLAIGYIKNKEVDWPLVRISFIVAFMMVLIFAIANHDDWRKAKQNYEYEMGKKYGENWEDILDAAEIESIEESQYHYH